MKNVSMHRGVYISWCNDDISVHYYAPRLPLRCYHCGSYAELRSISDEMKNNFSNCS